VLFIPKTHEKLMKTSVYLLVSLMWLYFTCLIPVEAVDKPEPLRIQSVLFNPDSKTISLVAQEDEHCSSEFQIVKLNDPDRIIVDIPNAILSTNNRIVQIHQDGIEHIELSQSVGTYYQVTRVVIYVANDSVLDAAQVQPRGNMLVVGLAGSTSLNQTSFLSPQKQSSILDRPLAPNQTVLESVSFENGMLKLATSPGHTLRIKNQFTLKGPNRLVVDLADTVLKDKSQTAPMDINSNGIQMIRAGQFDEDTVRLVITTDHPNTLYLTYPGEDKSQLVLSSSFGHSIRTLPLEDQQVGFVQDISLDKRDGTNVIRINTSSPLVRRVVRHGNNIEVDLLNIAAKPSYVAFDQQAYPDLKEIRLLPLNASEPNTKMIITLDNPAMEMDSHLSLDQKSLEITLSPTPMPYTSSGRMPVIVNDQTHDENIDTYLPPLKRGAYTVVIDPGHGGKDLGANRDGVYEKELNLEVALKLKRALEAKGVTVYMTRTTDHFLELSEISAIANRIHPDAFVSVHTNASVSPTADGLETYYYTPQSRNLAFLVHRRVVNLVASPDRGVRTARFYVIHHTSVPAILFEMGYISNPLERAALQTDTRQHATAEGIAEGVVEFLGRNYKAEASQGESF
jgi:N-acetylmuramoyl-L-alanine amidase